MRPSTVCHSGYVSVPAASSRITGAKGWPNSSSCEPDVNQMPIMGPTLASVESAALASGSAVSQPIMSLSTDRAERGDSSAAITAGSALYVSMKDIFVKILPAAAERAVIEGDEKVTICYRGCDGENGPQGPQQWGATACVSGARPRKFTS